MYSSLQSGGSEAHPQIVYGQCAIVYDYQMNNVLMQQWDCNE